MKIEIGSYVRIVSDYPAIEIFKIKLALLRLYPTKSIVMNIWLNSMAGTL